MHLLTEPLRGQIEWVQRRHGLTPVAASLAVLVTVLGVCGPSRQINDPISLRSLPPAFSVVLYGSPAAYLPGAVEAGLDPIRQWVIQRIGPPDKTQLRRVRLRLGELHQQRIGKETHLNSATLGSQAADKGFGGMMKNGELEVLQTSLKEELAKIDQEIQDTTFLLRPHLLVDDAALPRLLKPGSLSTDGAVLHVSLGGHAIPAWTGAAATTKAELARLLNLAWHGLPDAGDEDDHARPLLSNVLVVDEVDARSLQADHALIAAGTIRHLFFVKAAAGTVTLDLTAGRPEEVAKPWIEGLNALLAKRLAGDTIHHHLDEPAAEVSIAFARELSAGIQRSSIEQTRRLERAPVLALKLALLVHAISPARAVRAIGAKTAEFACAMASALCTDDLQFMNPEKPGAAAPGGRKMTALVAKLQLRGPLPWRALLRGTHDQKAESLQSLLESAIMAGLVSKEGDKFQAVKPAGTP